MGKATMKKKRRSPPTRGSAKRQTNRRQKRSQIRLAGKSTCDFLAFAQGLSVDDLNLVDYAKAAASKLQSDFPGVIFTSGRRDTTQQANAMAGNVVQKRNWIADTYVASTERDDLQAWVDANPTATTKEAIANGLAGIMANWTDDQKGRLSRHFSGQAFDVQPVAGSTGEDIKAAIKSLPNLRKFLDNEGGLVIWHADFQALPT
jgi:hypothetical protein